MTIAGQRAAYDAMCRDFHQGRPAWITVKDRPLAALPARHYCCAQADDADRFAARILYIHGGGFVVGNLDSHDDVCAEICARSGLDVIAIAYRLAPEHRHPAMFDDCVAATQALLDEDVLRHDAAVSKRIIGQILIYPSLGPDTATGSFVAHANAPMLTRADVQYYLNVRLDGPLSGSDPTLQPLDDTDFSGLPPTVVVTAECDPLRDDGPGYCSAITAAGGKAKWIDAAGLVHGFLRARGSSARAAAAFTHIIDAAVMLASSAWTFE
jgi:acetyl esterase